jgi:DNA-directed RNA polymerase subunit RPC12/RpoP
MRLTLGGQCRDQQLEYYCSKCGTLLRTTEMDIHFKFSNSNEECPYCGSLISEILRKEKEQPTNIDLSSLSLLPKIQTAYEEFSNRLTFDIEKIDSVLKFIAGESVCIVSANKIYNNILLTRLCIRALMSKRQGGLNSSKVIFVDASNTSDIYLYVNFARQYGLNIKKALQSIVISRSFTMYQLANIIINDLPKVIEQFDGTKVIIISDLLYMFVNDPQVQIKEAESLIRQIVNEIRKMSSYNNILFIISFYSNRDNYSSTHVYTRILLHRIDKYIVITKNKDNNNLLFDIKINKSKNHYQEHRRIIIQEKTLYFASR